MNVKKIIGIVATLLLLSSCEKDNVIYIELNGPICEEPVTLLDPVNNTLKDFSELRTKGEIVIPTWQEGSSIVVYSIAEDSTILFSSVVPVYNINKNLGKIKAEVAKECEGYFAGYPSNFFDYKVGDKITFPNDKNYGGTPTIERFQEIFGDGLFGEFGNMCVMTSWCDWCDENVNGYFKFHTRFSLFEVTGYNKNSDLPMRFEINYKDGNTYESPLIKSTKSTSLYCPIAAEDIWVNNIKVYYHSSSGNRYCERRPNQIFKVGHIYATDIKK